MKDKIDKEFVVAIELGSSHISGIAGRKKDGTMQILAYAEEKTDGCVKRGVVYNIEKTYQNVTKIIKKLEGVLKKKIVRAYVGVAGQSVRSYKGIVKRDLLTQSYITSEAIDSIRQESCEIPFSDYEVLENFPQKYVVDSNVVTNPVGVMGTNIEGEFLNVIAKKNLQDNIDTVFANVGVDIVEKLISPLQLAGNLLTDAEKRSGCALVDLGADTTTVVVYKNNIVRYLVTIPLGSNNINKDLATLPIDEVETENVKLMYGDACQDHDQSEDVDPQSYTTSDGRNIDVALIRNVIEARVKEIIDNVNNQLLCSNYSEQLLAGLVITGGGSNMKNIVTAFTKVTKIEKVRLATKVISSNVVKASSTGKFPLDSPRSTVVLSLLLAGTESCGGTSIGREPDIFDVQQEEGARAKLLEEAAAAAAAEAQNAITFDNIKTEIRKAIDRVKKQDEELRNYGRDKAVRNKAKELSINILDETIGEKYEKAVQALQGKEKFRQSLKEGADLAEMLKDAVAELTTNVNIAIKDNSAWGRFKRTLNDLVADDEN